MGIEIDWLDRNENVTVLYNNTTGYIQAIYGWTDVFKFLKEIDATLRDFFDEQDIETFEERFEQSLGDYLAKKVAKLEA